MTEAKQIIQTPMLNLFKLRGTITEAHIQQGHSKNGPWNRLHVKLTSPNPPEMADNHYSLQTFNPSDHMVDSLMPLNEVELLCTTSSRKYTSKSGQPGVFLTIAIKEFRVITKNKLPPEDTAEDDGLAHYDEAVQQ